MLPGVSKSLNLFLVPSHYDLSSPCVGCLPSGKSGLTAAYRKGKVLPLVTSVLGMILIGPVCVIAPLLDRSFYTPLSTIPQGRDSLVSLPSDWWGCSLLLEDSIEHDCFQPLLVLRKTKLYSKLPSNRSINPVSCFIISKLVLSEFSKNK